jgi:thioredoxin-related protein
MDDSPERKQSYVSVDSQANEPGSAEGIQPAMPKVTVWLLVAALAAASLLALPPAGLSIQEHAVPRSADLQADAALAQSRQVPLLLVFEAAHCPYCRELEASYLRPMLISGDYDDKVLIRSVDLDEQDSLKNFQGEAVTPGALADRYRIRVTPTMVFVGPSGEELTERLVGVGVVDFYAAEIDAAIDAAIRQLRR